MVTPKYDPKLSTQGRSLVDGLANLIELLKKDSGEKAVWMGFAGEVLLEKLKAGEKGTIYTVVGNWQRDVYEYLGNRRNPK